MLASVSLNFHQHIKTFYIHILIIISLSLMILQFLRSKKPKEWLVAFSSAPKTNHHQINNFWWRFSEHLPLFLLYFAFCSKDTTTTKISAPVACVSSDDGFCCYYILIFFLDELRLSPLFVCLYTLYGQEGDTLKWSFSFFLCKIKVSKEVAHRLSTWYDFYDLIDMWSLCYINCIWWAALMLRPFGYVKWVLYWSNLLNDGWTRG